MSCAIGTLSTRTEFSHTKVGGPQHRATSQAVGYYASVLYHLIGSDVNKDWTLKDKDKNQTLMDKDKDKDLPREA